VFDDIVLRAPERLRYAARARWRLLSIRELRIDETRKVSGLHLMRATSNRRQGEWLARLAVRAARGTDEPLRVLELGTSVGISGMYLLAGMAEGRGGHLATFEGRPTMAEIAERNMRGFIEHFALRNVGFEIVAGRFEQTYEPYVRAAKAPFHLVFIDGDHDAERTLQYHAIARAALSGRGIIVHDDIAWSPDMVRAWRAIRQQEADHLVVELMQGNRPSRGVLLYGEPGVLASQRFHLDRFAERALRQVVTALRQARRSGVP
jgi:predicted O-methyltransferase YrrM